MTRDMLIYASSDVLCLVPQVYNAMYRYNHYHLLQIIHFLLIKIEMKILKNFSNNSFFLLLIDL